ncbi:MAG: hypothetical protein MI975_24020 [Cytophagales bacterium]|nr:hypothetical protein [Cytophagales bacterium]
MINFTQYIFLFAVFLIGSEVFGQLEQPDRLEIEMEDEDENFSVVTADKHGIVLYREVRNRETRMERKYQVILVDTALHKKWERSYYVHLRYIIRGWEYFGDYFYLLFQRNTESLKADLFVMRIDLETKAYETFLIEREYSMEITEFEVVGNTLIFGGYSNNLPTIICYKFGKIQPIVLPGIFNEKTQIQQLEIDNDLRIFNVLTSFRTKDGTKSLSLKSFTEEGDLIKNVNLKPTQERSLLFGRTVKLDRNVELVVGTYTRKRSDLSRGIYIARISEDGGQVINYYNYADLKNFFSYMKARRQKRVEERIKRRKIKGKKNKFNYRLLVHDVVEKDGRFIMVGEAFYPKYTSSSSYGGYYSYFGNQYNTFFEGYKYTHAVVFGFDRRGRLIWDNSFEINDIESYTLEQFVHISMTEEEMALVYVFENEIRTKIIEGNEVLEGKTFNELKLSFEDDIVANSEDEYGGLEKWYDGNLFAYGIHKLKNMKDDGVKLNREVFFINKIRYQ